MRLPLALLSGFLLLAACGSDTSPTMDISGTANGDADGDRSGQADGAGPSPDGHPAGCKSDKECDSGICLKAMADGVCAEFCDGQGGCPYEGWGCFPTYDKSGPFQALCLPVEGVLCTPCASDADCTTLDGSFGALCLPVEDQGHFCGYPCIAHTDCPEGYVCKAFELPDGKLAGQCRPKGVQCVCNEVGKRLSWTVPCGFENEAGTCSGETVCPPAGAAVCSAPVPEVDECNGFDDDCNGVVDDGPTIGEECGHSNKGECRKGVIACVDGEEICDGAVMPVDEICDGKDNDCDWETDEDYPEQMQPCGTDVGACMPGTSLCQGGTLLCIDPVGPTEEICDAKDNDCDGKTDEELPGAGEPCGSDVGECEPGAMACLGGVWSCEGGVLPDTEICDGKDTDCDGEVDPLPCADDPVLYYRFEEDDAVVDSSGNGLSGTIGGAVTLGGEGRYGKGAALSQYASIKASFGDGLLVAPPLSIQLWARAATPPDTGTPFQLARVGGAQDKGQALLGTDFELIPTASTQWSAAPLAALTHDLFLPLGRWTHLGLVWTKDDLSLYRDGKLVATAALQGAPLQAQSAISELLLGHIAGSGGRGFTGSIDEVAVYGAAIDFAQDGDGDGTPDVVDNCVAVVNAVQSDCDGDGIGDACDSDTEDGDGDGVADACDNCPNKANPGQVDNDPGIPQGTYWDVDTFETGPGGADEWNCRNGIDPAITNQQAFTGSYGLSFPTSMGRAFELAPWCSGCPEGACSANFEAGQSSGYKSDEYPYLCMAYRMPAGTSANMLIHVTGTGWRSITISQTELPCKAPRVATWYPVALDGKWHHKCIDLDAQLDASLGAKNHEIQAIIMHPGGWSCTQKEVGGAFHIDDFRVSKEPVSPWDGVGNACDNCPGVYNPGQKDSDGNGIGDACE